MKKIILTVAFIASGLVASAQVGVGTTNPETSLEVVGANADLTTKSPGALSTADGITVPVVTNDMTITVANGTPAGTRVSQMVYSNFTGKTGYYFWDGTKWNSMVPSTEISNLPTFRTQVGIATMVINPSDVGNIVLFKGGIAGEIKFPTPTADMVGKKLTLIEVTDGVAPSHNLTNLNANYKTVTLSILQQFGSEFITDGVNWYGLGGQ